MRTREAKKQAQYLYLPNSPVLNYNEHDLYLLSIMFMTPNNGHFLCKTKDLFRSTYWLHWLFVKALTRSLIQNWCQLTEV